MTIINSKGCGRKQLQPISRYIVLLIWWRPWEKKKNLKGLCSVRDSNRIPPDHMVRRVAPSCSVHSLSLDTKQRECINKAYYEYEICTRITLALFDFPPNTRLHPTPQNLVLVIWGEVLHPIMVFGTCTANSHESQASDQKALGPSRATKEAVR